MVLYHADKIVTYLAIIDSTFECLGCFQNFVIVNKSTMKIFVASFFPHLSLGYTFRMELRYQRACTFYFLEILYKLIPPTLLTKYWVLVV